jgi:hypothetical protein
MFILRCGQADVFTLVSLFINGFVVLQREVIGGVVVTSNKLISGVIESMTI